MYISLVCDGSKGMGNAVSQMLNLTRGPIGMGTQDSNITCFCSIPLSNFQAHKKVLNRQLGLSQDVFVEIDAVMFFQMLSAEMGMWLNT